MSTGKSSAAEAKKTKPRFGSTALSQSKQVKGKVEECVQELTSVNDVLKQESTGDSPLKQIKQALAQSENVEIKVQECADDLSVVNIALGKENTNRDRLERKLAKSQHDLAHAQAELSETKIELSVCQGQEKQALQRALHDIATGLPNRVLFHDRLKNALAMAKRHAGSLAVMFIDLDKFKWINDSHGHGAGDRVLKIVSDRLRAAVRDADTVGRQGGDEFLYLMLEVKDEADVINVALKLIESIGQPCEFDGLSLRTKPSIGIALFPRDGRSASVLLKNADSAMYHAKRTDHGYCFYAPA